MVIRHVGALPYSERGQNAGHIGRGHRSPNRGADSVAKAVDVSPPDGALATVGGMCNDLPATVHAVRKQPGFVVKTAGVEGATHLLESNVNPTLTARGRAEAGVIRHQQQLARPQGQRPPVEAQLTGLERKAGEARCGLRQTEHAPFNLQRLIFERDR